MEYRANLLHFMLFSLLALLWCLKVSSEGVPQVSSHVTVGVPRARRTLYGGVCPHGCASCSAVNGCVTCRARYFLYLHRNGIRQSGVCVSTCPAGHIEMLTGRHRHCARCRVDLCNTCLTRNYCSVCKKGSFSHRGKCFSSCPDGLLPQNSTRECLANMDCAVSSWGPWGLCTRVAGKSCRARYGVKTRVREIVRLPSSSGRRCPPNTQYRRCRIARTSAACPAAGEGSSDSFIGADTPAMPATNPRGNKRRGRKRKKGGGKPSMSSVWNRRSGFRSRHRNRNRTRKGQFRQKDHVDDSSNTNSTEVSNQLGNVWK